MKYSHVYFDFDGTLCDSFDVFKKAFHFVAQEFNLNTSCLESKNLRDLPTKEILKELNVSLIKLPLVVKRGREEMFKLRDELKLFPETIPLLSLLKDQGRQVGILTSNSRELVEFLIGSELMQSIHIAKPSPLFGKAKILKGICSENKVPFENFLYVGDETRDIDAAIKAKVDSLAVTYGYNSKKVLLKQNPTYHCESEVELIKLFTEII